MMYMTNRNGYTLVEVVTAAALTSMILVGFMSILIHSMWGWSRGISTDTASESITAAMQRLSSDTRAGKSASVANNVLTVTFPNKVTDSTTGESMYNLSSSSYTTRQYFVSNSKLMRRVDGSDSVLARGITSATFQIQGGSINVTMTGYDKSGRFSATEETNGRIFLRNYR